MTNNRKTGQTTMKASRQAALLRKHDQMLWSTYAMHPAEGTLSQSPRSPAKPRGPRHSKKKK